jgi:hypothetical protein
MHREVSATLGTSKTVSRPPCNGRDRRIANARKDFKHGPVEDLTRSQETRPDGQDDGISISCCPRAGVVSIYSFAFFISKHLLFFRLVCGFDGIVLSFIHSLVYSILLVKQILR